MSVLGPVSRQFTSIEGESTRVGQLTDFVVLGDAPMSDSEKVARWVNSSTAQRLVVNVCEVLYFNWVPFAVDLIERVNKKPSTLETRGDRGRPADCDVYLHLTPGVTRCSPSNLLVSDEVKMLAHVCADVEPACRALRPFALAGFPSFVLVRSTDPRVLRDCFEEFIAMQETHVRMMLVEHEMVGIK